jgi:uncharacterized membrane protein
MRSSDFRAKARQILAGKWLMAVLVTFVAGIFGVALASEPVRFNLNINIDENILQYMPEAMAALFKMYLTIAASIGGVLGLVQFLLGGVVKLGYCKYLLNLHDGQEANIKDLFSQFGRFADGLLLNLLTAIYTFLWTLLFIIPGIVAAYRYAMAPFIMLENPNMRAGDAITASKKMMDGHKGELFILDLSFIGWALLSGLFTMGIGNLWLNPYMNASHAAFYRNLNPAQVVMDTPTYVIPEAPTYTPTEVVEE